MLRLPTHTLCGLGSSAWFAGSLPEDWALADVCLPLGLGLRVGPETDISPPPLLHLSLSVLIQQGLGCLLIMPVKLVS